MRIPNINLALNFAGVASQSAKETTDSSKAKQASSEANQQTNAENSIEDVSKSEAASDRDAQEKYEGPAPPHSLSSRTSTEDPSSERIAPSVFDLPVADDNPPPALDTRA